MHRRVQGASHMLQIKRHASTTPISHGHANSPVHRGYHLDHLGSCHLVRAAPGTAHGGASAASVATSATQKEAFRRYFTSWRMGGSSRGTKKKSRTFFRRLTNQNKTYSKRRRVIAPQPGACLLKPNKRQHTQKRNMQEFVLFLAPYPITNRELTEPRHAPPKNRRRQDEDTRSYLTHRHPPQSCT